MPKIIEIRKCSFKLQLKMSGVFFETQCRPYPTVQTFHLLYAWRLPPSIQNFKDMLFYLLWDTLYAALAEHAVAKLQWIIRPMKIDLISLRALILNTSSSACVLSAAWYAFCSFSLRRAYGLYGSLNTSILIPNRRILKTLKIPPKFTNFYEFYCQKSQIFNLYQKHHQTVIVIST